MHSTFHQTVESVFFKWTSNTLQNNSYGKAEERFQGYLLVCKSSKVYYLNFKKLEINTRTKFEKLIYKWKLKCVCPYTWWSKKLWEIPWDK